MTIRHIFTTLIMIMTLLSSADCQTILTPCKSCGEKDTTFKINPSEAFLISATFKRMIYLNGKSDMLIELNSQNQAEIKKYKELVDYNVSLIAQKDAELSLIRQQMQSETMKKIAWRKATFISAPSAFVIGFGVALYLMK